MMLCASFSLLRKHLAYGVSLLLWLCLSSQAVADKVDAGVIALSSVSCPSEQLCFPDTKIAVFDGAAGNKIGYIQQVNRFDLSIQVPEDLRDVLKDGLTWHQQLTYDSNAIGFTTLNNGYVMIAKAKDKAFWLNTKDLTAVGYRAFVWPQFITKYKGMISPSDFLNLRVKPIASAKRITRIGVDSEVLFTGNFKGSWAEVKVKIHDKHICYVDSKLLGEYTGWIKYFDEQTNTLNFDLGGSC